jgi:hypothetical protein
MDTEKKIGSEITVRISLTFQDAPDVHTLLAMTPVRQRRKLVRLALERYIVETGHSAGNVDVQIEAVSTWLKGRNTQTYTESALPKKYELIQSHILNGAQKMHDPTSDINITIEKNVLVEDKKSTSQVQIASSASMIRWLDS